jgi:ABC-2 type transporter
LEELGLTDCADTMVGGALIKGISGGQRKRTSVGVELVTKPALVFLDEPTSGLDSFSAVQLCQVLKKVANAGASVLFTIHQPSSEIFNSFDSLILMNAGRVMYDGPTADVPRFFGERGHPNPPHFNPADWIMQVAQSVSLEQLDKDGFFPKDNRELGKAFTDAGDGKDALGITITQHPDAANDSESSESVGMGTQISMLFSRELRNLRRDTMALGARFGLTIFLSVLVGVIFFDVGEEDSNVPTTRQSQFGALVMVAMMVRLVLISVLTGARTSLLTLRRICFGSSVHVWNGSTSPFGVSRGTSCLFERILDESLWRPPLLFVSVDHGVGHHWFTSLGAGRVYLLHGGISIRLWYFLHWCLHTGHEQYCHGSHVGMCRGRPQTGSRDASHFVCPTNAVFGILRGTRAYSRLATMGTVFVFFDVCVAHPGGGRVQSRRLMPSLYRIFEYHQGRSRRDLVELASLGGSFCGIPPFWVGNSSTKSREVLLKDNRQHADVLMYYS